MLSLPLSHPAVDRSRPLILGLSGGADSVCLLDLLHRSGYRIVAVHVDFHLRGEESERDEAFVRRLIRERYPDVTLEVGSYDTLDYARTNGLSVEMAARELRYNRFARLREAYDASAIAVAHHADDQVETALINLARGTGGRGLAGMRLYDPRSALWRPLLTVSRREILRYLESRSLPHVEDSTNADLTIRRNLIRHRLIPLFEEINPSFRQSMLETIDHLREEQDYIDLGVRRALDTLRDAATESLDLSGDRYAIYRILTDNAGLTATQAERILSPDTGSGALFEGRSGDRYELFRRRLYRLRLPDEAVGPVPAQQRMKWAGCLGIELEEVPAEGWTVRAARPDDRFTLRGMPRGRKELYEYLKECGIPSSYRPFCPVLADETDRVRLVLCRHRGRQPFRLTPLAPSPLAHLLARCSDG